MENGSRSITPTLFRMSLSRMLSCCPRECPQIESAPGVEDGKRHRRTKRGMIADKSRAALSPGAKPNFKVEGWSPTPAKVQPAQQHPARQPKAGGPSLVCLSQPPGRIWQVCRRQRGSCSCRSAGVGGGWGGVFRCLEKASQGGKRRRWIKRHRILPR